MGHRVLFCLVWGCSKSRIQELVQGTLLTVTLYQFITLLEIFVRCREWHMFLQSQVKILCQVLKIQFYISLQLILLFAQSQIQEAPLWLISEKSTSIYNQWECVYQNVCMYMYNWWWFCTTLPLENTAQLWNDHQYLLPFHLPSSLK